MHFILLFQFDEQRWDDLTESERDRTAAHWADYAQAMVASGRAQHPVMLHPSFTATTLRLRNDRCVITDGPFHDAKEVLAGYQIIECRNLDEAIEVAARFPPLRAGASVEVRPIRADENLHL